jgi:dTMP kinase
MAKGIFIVFEGNDGSGKATQTKLLAERLEKQGTPIEVLSFPSYNQNFFGTLLAECLAGKRGDFVHLDPKIASTLYALDRFEETPRIESALEDGKVVITDRFTSSNQIHQGGKIQDAKERDDFLIWLDGLEHATLHIPRPDAVLYLHVPLETSLALLKEKRDKKNSSMDDDGKDVVEENEAYMRQSHETAKWLAGRQTGWHTISCAEGGKMRSREDIHEDVYKAIAALL